MRSIISYVDDMLILAKKQSDIHRCHNQLKSAFKMKLMNKYKKILEKKVGRNFIKNLEFGIS